MTTQNPIPPPDLNPQPSENPQSEQKDSKKTIRDIRRASNLSTDSQEVKDARKAFRDSQGL